jgi:sugar lactone lactonase YvrE
VIVSWIMLAAVTGCGQTPSDPFSCAEPGTICTVAGTGLSVFDGDGRDALDTGFYFPLDVEFEPSGLPLILDFNNIRVRRINADGRVETVMGLDYEDYPQEGALAVETPLHHASDLEFDSQGQLYVAVLHSGIVIRVGTDQRVSIMAGSVEIGDPGDGGPARDATIIAPYGVIPDRKGGFYLTDSGTHVVRYVGADGIINTVAGFGTAGYSGDGGPALQAQLHSPTRLRLDAEGLLYICDTGNSVIRRVDAAGIISTIAGTGRRGYSGDGGLATEARFDAPLDVRFDPAGDLYVADTGNSAIRRIDKAGVVTTVVGDGTAGFWGDYEQARTCQLNQPGGITFDDSGALWIADTYNQRVRRVTEFLATMNP